MQNQLIPSDLLKKSDKILFVTHLALGDFTYMQNYFGELAQKYPNLKIDILIDEARGKSFLRRWRKDSKYVLFDWIKSCPWINEIYYQTNSWWRFRSLIKELRTKKYPIVVSLGSLKQYKFAKFARLISPNGFISGIADSVKFYNFVKKYNLKKLDAPFRFNLLQEDEQRHIVNIYASWFEHLFGINVEQDKRLPFIKIPRPWAGYGKLKLLKWGIYNKGRKTQKVVFINVFAKNQKRCWQMDNVLTLVNELKKDDLFYDFSFIINVLPNQYKHFEKIFSSLAMQRIFVFTADVNFFQLPTIIGLCDLVISVETSVIHFAAALNVPVIALMRQKNPEWVPFGCKSKIVYTVARKDWINDICVDQVVEATKSFFPQTY